MWDDVTLCRRVASTLYGGGYEYSYYYTSISLYLNTGCNRKVVRVRVEVLVVCRCCGCEEDGMFDVGFIDRTTRWSTWC